MKMKLPRPLLVTAIVAIALSPRIVIAAEKAPTPTVATADARLRAALTAADDERLEATKAGDKARLDAIFSADLHYAHSSGKIDSKESYMTALVSRRSIYDGFEYMERTFKIVSPGLALMTGRVLVKTGTAEKKSLLDLNFLAVWREENGRWRFLAWQSCKNPPPPEPTAK